MKNNKIDYSKCMLKKCRECKKYNYCFKELKTSKNKKRRKEQ